MTLTAALALATLVILAIVLGGVMNPTTAAGSALAISAGTPSNEDAAGYGALTFVDIGFIERIGTFGANFSKTEFQPLRGPKMKLKGAADYGTLSPTLAINDNDPGQALLRVAADDLTPRLYSFQVTFPDGSLRWFQGSVFGFPETADGADVVITASPSIEISTKVVRGNAVSDSTPDDFSFGVRSGVSLDTDIVSDPVTITGINVPAPISGGPYSIDGGPFVTTSGTILPNQQLRTKVRSSTQEGVQTGVSVTVGGITRTFKVTTATAQAPSAPANTVAPAITGASQDGSTLSVSNGSWTGSPTGFAYQWFSSATNSPSGGTAISGATAATLLLTTSLVGLYLYCRVTATNAGGPASANSNVTSPVAAASGQTGSATLALVWASTDITYDPRFTFSGVTFAVGDTLQLQVSTAANFATLYGDDTETMGANEVGGGDISFPSIPTLEEGVTYYARARVNGGAWSTAVSKTMFDGTAAQFTFTDLADQEPSTLLTSNGIQILDVTAGTDIAASVSGPVEYRITRGGTPGSWLPPGNFTVRRDDIVHLHATTGAYSTSFAGVLTVNGVTDTWNVSVKANPAGIIVVPSAYMQGREAISGFPTSSTRSIDFAAGIGFIYLWSNYADVTGVTANGVACTKVVDISTKAGIYRIPGTVTAGNKTVVVSYGSGNDGIEIGAFTVQQANGTITPLTAGPNAYTFDPHDYGSTIAVPPNNVLVVVAVDRTDGSPFVWNSPAMQTIKVATDGHSRIAIATGNVRPSANNGAGGFVVFAPILFS